MTKDQGKMVLNIKGKEVHIPLDREKEFLNGPLQRPHLDGDLAWRILRIQSEFVKGHDFLKNYDKAVTIFGSARSGMDPSIYAETEELAGFLAKDGFVVFTGGGPGIMEAANKGAKLAGGQSVGININLPGNDRMTERRNEYVTEGESFDYFFSRKVILSYASQFYIALPGGFGTMDELFEMLTLIQTGKMSPIPIILVNQEFWGPLVDWIKNTMLEKNGTISEKDIDLFHLVDTAEQARDYIHECMSN